MALEPSFNRETGETAWVKRVQQGDIDAYEPLMKAHLRAVRTFLALRSPVPHLVDEIAHEAFVLAYSKIQDFRAGTSFRAWILAIALQLLRQEVQKYASRSKHKNKLAEHLAIEQARQGIDFDRSGDFEALERCLSHLESDQRQLLDLKYRQGFSTKELAKATSRSADWVRTNLYRLRAQLRNCIKQTRS